MAAVAMSCCLFNLRPELELCLRSRALTSFSRRVKGVGGVWLRRLVSFRQGCSDEGNAYAERSLFLSLGRNSWQLRQKVVPGAEADQATRSVLQDGEEQMTQGFSEASMDHLFAQASKQWQRGNSLPLEKRRARIVRWLQCRGFKWAMTNAIIRRLEAQHPL